MEAARSLHSTMQTEAAIRLILPLSAIQGSARAVASFDLDNLRVRQVIKKHANALPVELDVQYPVSTIFSIDYIYGELKKKLQVNFPFQKLPTEQYYGWAQSQYIEGANFRLNASLATDKTSSFQLLGDAVSLVASNRVEGALQSAKAAAEAFV